MHLFFLGHGFSFNSTMHPYPNTFNGLYMGLGFVRLWWSDFGHHHLGETMTFPTSRTSQAVMLATPSLFRFGPAIFPILETSLTVIDLLHFHMFRPVDHLSFNKKERQIYQHMKGCDLEVISSRWLAYNQIDDPLTITGIGYLASNARWKHETQNSKEHSPKKFRMVTNGSTVDDNADWNVMIRKWILFLCDLTLDLKF